MKLAPVTTSFVLAAAVTVLFNTVLAIVKDSHKSLNDFMASLSGHQWTTHGLADLILFLALGFLFLSLKVGRNMAAQRAIPVLVASVVVASVGLAVWYALF
jgi:uncharacterized membrane protein SirB2